MTTSPDREPWPLGPFHREPFHVSVAPDLTPGTQAWLAAKIARMEEALGGIELGPYDHRILRWLVTWESSTLAVIAGWLKRARLDGYRAAECPGCDRRGLDTRQEANGDLVCHRCGRMVAPTERRPPDRQAFLIEFAWADASSNCRLGSGHAIANGATAEEAEQRWRDDQDAGAWPSYEVLGVEPLGDQIIWRYRDSD